MEPDSSSPYDLASDGLTIDIAMQSPLWDNIDIDLSEGWIKAQLRPLLALKDIRLGELSIALIDDAQMSALNHNYRDKTGPTNVLSFPAEAPLLGDIVLSYETVAKEAAEKSVSFDAHLTHLLIHGFLHLQGYDHQNEAEANEMEALEIAALAQLHIDNPYENTRLD